MKQNEILVTLMTNGNFKYNLIEKENKSYIIVSQYVYDVDGYVNVAKIETTNNYWTKNYFEIQDLFHELQCFNRCANAVMNLARNKKLNLNNSEY